MSCMIPANPDISGPGVRVAIYVQNFLSFIPAFWALTNKIVSKEGLNTVEKQSMSILITAFAILISTIVQACTFGLSDFHTSIILSLSWMNNTNTFIYFLLYISYKTHHGMVDPQWKAWLNHAWEVVSSHAPPKDEKNHRTTGDDRAHVQDPNGTVSPAGFIGRIQHTLRAVKRRIIFTLGSLHLTLMAAIGIWLWSSPVNYEQRQENRTDGMAFDGSDGLPLACTYVSLVGSNVPLTSAALRYASLVMYSLFLVPVLNLLVPAIFFLLMFIGVRWRRFQPARTGSTGGGLLPVHHDIGSNDPLATSVDHSPQVSSGVENDIEAVDHKPSIIPIWIGLIVLLVINIVFVADIEVAIFRAKQNHNQLPGESEWTFGQTLALLLLVLPIRDVIDYGAIQEQIRARLATRKMIAAVLKGDEEAAFKAAKIADDLFVHINARHPSILMFAAAVGNLEIVELVLLKRIKDATDPEHGLKILIEQVDHNGRTPLIWAAREGHEPVVQLLLEHGADVQQADNNNLTPLIWAANGGHESVVQLLLERGANVNQANQYGETPLICAAERGHESVVQLLLERGANVNQANQYSETPLFCAANRGHEPVVQLLLERGANVSQANQYSETPLILAARGGHEPVVQLPGAGF